MVSVPVSVWTHSLPNSFLYTQLDLEARVGIERFMLCFPRKLSQETTGSQGYSATTRLSPILLVHHSATEEFTECNMTSFALARGRTFQNGATVLSNANHSSTVSAKLSA